MKLENIENPTPLVRERASNAEHPSIQTCARSIRCSMLGVRCSMFPANLIHQHQHRRLLRRLHHVLKLPFARVWRFELGGNFRHGFEKAQKKTALHRVIDILRQWVGRATRPSRSATRRTKCGDTRFVIGRRLQSHARRHSVRRVAGRHRPVACATRTGTLIWKYRASSLAPDSDAISPLSRLGGIGREPDCSRRRKEADGLDNSMVSSPSSRRGLHRAAQLHRATPLEFRLQPVL